MNVISYFSKFSTAKSPVFTHLGATMNGLSTIRAFNKQAILQKEFDNYQDLHSGCWYMSMSSTSLFSLYVDLLTAIFTACILTYYMLFGIESSGVEIGLAVSQAISLAGRLPWGKNFH